MQTPFDGNLSGIYLSNLRSLLHRIYVVTFHFLTLLTHLSLSQGFLMQILGSSDVMATLGT